MPIARYFLFVGGVLLALLFISDAVLLQLPVAARATAELPVIRIHSHPKWPDRVVFDTTIPNLAPVQTAKADVPAPVTAAAVSGKARVGGGFGKVHTSRAQPG